MTFLHTELGMLCAQQSLQNTWLLFLFYCISFQFTSPFCAFCPNDRPPFPRYRKTDCVIDGLTAICNDAYLHFHADTTKGTPYTQERKHLTFLARIISCFSGLTRHDFYKRRQNLCSGGEKRCGCKFFSKFMKVSFNKQECKLSGYRRQKHQSTV